MNVTTLRRNCIDKIAKASPSTLRMVLKLLESEVSSDGALKVTTILSGATTTTKQTIYLEADSNDIFGLAHRVWLSLIQMDGNLTNKLALVQKQQWYRASPAMSNFENLCLNGCGVSTKSKSRYCSPDCLKALSKWLDSQREKSEKQMRRLLFNKVNRFKKAVIKDISRFETTAHDFE